MPLKTRSRLSAWLDFMRTSLFHLAHRSPPWTAEVGAVVADLQNLNRATEEDFLAIGGKLMTFLSDSRQLHDGIAGLTGLGSGEQAERACHALGSVRLFVGEMQGRAESGGRTLLVLQAGADRIRRGFSSFGKIVLSFRMAAIAAKIEVADLAFSQQNLESLADDVSSCSDGIRERVAGILAVASDFDSRIAETLREISSFEVIQMRELPSLLAAVDADVRLFQTRQRKTVEGSLKLAAELDSVARELGAVATSIQFHDITRQQTEHVIEALQVLIRKAPKGAISSPDAALVRLQRRQLENAGQPSSVPRPKSTGILKSLQRASERWPPPAIALKIPATVNRTLFWRACSAALPPSHGRLRNCIHANAEPAQSLPICGKPVAVWRAR